MAFWVLAGGANSLRRLPDDDGASCFDGGKRKMAGFAHGHADDEAALHGCCVQKRARMAPWAASHDYFSDSVPVRNLAFLVIREGDAPASPSPSPSPSPDLASPDLVSPVPTPPCAAGHSSEPPRPGFARGLGAASAPPCAAMERTESGLSISSTPSPRDGLSSLALDDDDDATGRVLDDLEAARLVRAHLTAYRRRCPDSQAERILRALITPKSRAADFPLDNDALRSIFSATNELFFASRLARRVAWDWSHPACGQYQSHIVGTTALRRCARLGGWETLIVLSSPILRDTKYNRRLLISTFLHEMIHSFMFVTCGLKASHDGGHTDGFRQIAAIIDDWAGREYLRLGDMEADLERFRGDDDGDDDDVNGNIIGHQVNVNPNAPAIVSEEPRGWPRAHDVGHHHDHHDHLYHHHHHNHHHHHHHNHHPHDAQAALSPHHHAHPHPDRGAWQWCDDESFGMRSPGASSSPYVY